ncbi:glucuronyl hydrolase [Solitalea longa]|uniref:Glucuronyl hydrolase n=1 Tax=Solitalea longa TaxID=2079460 RepID=A0A2S4ZZX5_9SPHI|nr:glycoside hydrolase family 88 protein [Solitalea longa]POY35844.1 glucuronyl hydrolase [Solitalea longa]
MKKRSLIIVFILIGSYTGSGYAQNLSEKMAATVMTIWKDSLANPVGKPVKWAYDEGVVLEGMVNIWKRTGNADYFNFTQKSMDFFVQPDGSINRYRQDEYNIDNVKNGRSLLLLYKVTGDEKYYKACKLLREQLKNHPRTNEGGFWHKKIYPYQMWLDGLYMGAPFYTEYAATFNEPEAFDDIANQLIFMENHARDPKTGLLYHGWDESKQQAWANKTTGNSPNFWGRAMGWYGMALVDVLENFPANHPKRATILSILNRFATAITKVQDSKSGLWYNVLDKPKGKGNYKEASASCMLVYTLAKAVRLGYLPAKYKAVADKGYKGITNTFIETDANGQVNLNGTISVAGLGGKPYRDGSYEYYMSEKVVTNDPKGVGAFLLAANEMELTEIKQTGKGKTVMVDRYFNNEFQTDASGTKQTHHYNWTELNHGGFSLWGEHIRYTGAKTTELNTVPSAKSLKSANVYIIVDPDNEKDTKQPNYIEQPQINAITNWVKAGGVLVLMANDINNCDLDHLNNLAANFGIGFKKETQNKVTNNQFEMGKVLTSANSGLFTQPWQLYLKEISSLNVTAPAKTAVESNNMAIIAIAKVGKGTVLAVGDPWLYNEYTDGRKLPSSFKNLQAADDLTNWLFNQVPATK